MANEEAIVGEVRVGPRANHLSEVLNLGERVFEVNHRQHLDERGPFNLVERLHILVPVQQCVDGCEVRGDETGPGQIEPVDSAALERHRQVVHGEGAIRETEVEYFLDGGVRARRTPGQVRGVPVAVTPLRYECSQQRRGFLDRGEVVTGEVHQKGAMGNGPGEARACGHEALKLDERVGGRDDRAGARENPRPGWRQREVSSGSMKARERATRRSGVAETGEGVPRRHIAVKVYAGDPRADLVKVIDILHCRVSVRASKDGGECLTAGSQVTRELVFNAQSLRCANRNVMTLHEDRFVRAVNESRGGHWPWTAPRHEGSSCHAYSLVSIEVTKNGPHFVVSERGPVRFDERLAHSVHESTGWTCRGLVFPHPMMRRGHA